jgi:hypothetical protein
VHCIVWYPCTGTDSAARRPLHRGWFSSEAVASRGRFATFPEQLVYVVLPVYGHMPERGHQFYGTTSVRVSLVIQAPSRYVYDWCTDYRSDDGRLSSARTRPSFRVIRISPRRLVRIRVSRGSGRDPALTVEKIRLNPPRSWHMDQLDEADQQSVDYRVSSVGRARTRFKLFSTERWLTSEFPTREALRAQITGTWARFAAAIEADYRAGRPAQGR